MDPIAQEGKFLQFGLAGSDDLFEVVLLDQALGARVRCQVFEVVGTVSDVGLVEFEEFDVLEIAPVLFEVGGQGDALEHGGLIGRIGA